MRDDDQMKPRVRNVWQPQREWLLALSVEKYLIWKLPNPSFRAPDLPSGFQDSWPEPSIPVALEVSGVRKLAVLVGKNDDIVSEHHEEVADLFAVTRPVGSLVAV